MPERNTSDSDTYTVLSSHQEDPQKSRLVAGESSAPEVSGSYKLIIEAGILDPKTEGSGSNTKVDPNPNNIVLIDQPHPSGRTIITDAPTRRGP